MNPVMILYYWIMNHEPEVMLDLRKALYNIHCLKPLLEWMAD